MALRYVSRHDLEDLHMNDAGCMDFRCDCGESFDNYLSWERHRLDMSWEELISPEGLKYYVHKTTGERVWSRPDKMENDKYFRSYGSDMHNHKVMLRDFARNQAYRQGIMENSEIIRGSIVLDVGCGTGILSMFAAEAGASRVFAIDASDIVETTREIVKVNGFADVIEVIHGLVEDVKLPVDKVDVIISEWMGHLLLYEGMWETVLHARDRWLKPGGLMLPQTCRMFVSPLSCTDAASSHIDVWDHVDPQTFSQMSTSGIDFTLDMSPMKIPALSTFLRTPTLDDLDPAQVMGPPVTILSADMHTVTISELSELRHERLKLVVVGPPEIKQDSNRTHEFVEKAQHSDDIESTEESQSKENLECTQGIRCDTNSCIEIRAIGVWFDVSFGKTILSTAPWEATTHWGQTILLLPNPLLVNLNCGTVPWSTQTVCPLDTTQSPSIILSLDIIRNAEAPRNYKIHLKLWPSDHISLSNLCLPPVQLNYTSTSRDNKDSESDKVEYLFSHSYNLWL